MHMVSCLRSHCVGALLAMTSRLASASDRSSVTRKLGEGYLNEEFSPPGRRTPLCTGIECKRVHGVCSVRARSAGGWRNHNRAQWACNHAGGWVAVMKGTGFRGCVRTKKEPQQVPPLRSPRFPVEVGGVAEVPAAFFKESRIRGSRWLCEVGNPGTLRSG